MLVKFKNVLKDQRGQGLSEYSLIIALIAVISIAALLVLGPAIADKFWDIENEITNAKPKTKG